MACFPCPWSASHERVFAVPNKNYRTLTHLKTRREVTLEALRSEQRPPWRKIYTEALELIERRIAGMKKGNP